MTWILSREKLSNAHCCQCARLQMWAAEVFEKFVSSSVNIKKKINTAPGGASRICDFSVFFEASPVMGTTEKDLYFILRARRIKAMRNWTKRKIDF
jgi:hypothetical protein